MTLLTLTQAAKTVGIARSTLYRAIRNGRISVISQPNGNKGVDTSELQRVFGPLRDATKPTEQHDAPQDVPLLQARIDALERENRLLQDEIQASRERENKLLDVVSQGLLEAPKNRRRKGKKKSH
jgi:excisionase family DNA binding protein